VVLGEKPMASEGLLQVHRFWLRFVSLLSLCVYLLANTPASFALDYWFRSQIRGNSIA
jgi:hypothetical protein